jgi:tetratricopeptide (TPR) repeat protein
MNPLNVFRRDTTPASRPTPLRSDAGLPQPEPRTGSLSGAAANSRAAETATHQGNVYERYKYRLPAAPPSGNASGADRAFTQALQAHRANRLPEAVVGYRQAIDQDPAHFDAHYNLGLASVSTGNLQQALTAYETALAIRPQSLDARYNFALVLKQARHPVDAVSELQTILQQFPRDARTHAALGSLYAYELRQPDRAREHYMKALESDPRHPQADRIRYWLAENPR